MTPTTSPLFARERIKRAHKGRETRGVLPKATKQTVGSLTWSIVRFFLASSLLFLLPPLAYLLAVTTTAWFSAAPAQGINTYLISSIDPLTLAGATYAYWTPACAYFVYLGHSHAFTAVKYQTFRTPWMFRRDHVSHMRLDRLRRAWPGHDSSGNTSKTYSSDGVIMIFVNVASADTVALGSYICLWSLATPAQFRDDFEPRGDESPSFFDAASTLGGTDGFFLILPYGLPSICIYSKFGFSRNPFGQNTGRLIRVDFASQVWQHDGNSSQKMSAVFWVTGWHPVYLRGAQMASPELPTLSCHDECNRHDSGKHDDISVGERFDLWCQRSKANNASANQKQKCVGPDRIDIEVLGNEVSRADNTGRGKHYEEVRKHASKKGELCDINLAMEKGNDGDDELGRIPVASQYALACTWMDPTYPNEVFKNDPSHFRQRCFALIFSVASDI
ncbi:hypothetical protein B0H10DRAFT_2201302 [Mycena sp. CBHHK59/15]|nr:hypothetical protein B0H10DRAFT_2201302 [Mycena sp. CBHHK59/15]